MPAACLTRLSRCLPPMLGLLLLCAATAGHAAERHALIIGNGGYQHAPLRNPVTDARAMASALDGLGFDVVLLEDADQRQMEQAIRGFGRDLRGGGVGLFYFAGHGIQTAGRNYLVPIGADIHDESDIKREFSMGCDPRRASAARPCAITATGNRCMGITGMTRREHR